MKQKLLFLLLLVMSLPMTMMAENPVEVGEIFYNLIPKGKSAEVTSKDGGYSGVITIPPSIMYEGETYDVTKIGDNAFKDCTNLTAVTIPNSVKTIGGSAFQGCSSLTSINIPSSVTSIEGNAFNGCSDLTSIDIPNSVTSIGGNAFLGCSSLTSIDIPNSVTSIEVGEFAYCTNLTSINIPNSVTSIGGSAFRDCTSLTSIDIPNSVTSIENWAFGNTGLTSVTIGNSVTSIGDCAFSNCTGLASVTIGNSVTSIGNYAFSNCTGLASVTIGNSVTSIGSGAFYECTSLTSIDIPNSVTSIGNFAFSNCTGLASVTYGNNLQSIGDYAFNNCTSLTSIDIQSEKRMSIGNYAFEGCSKLASVNIGKYVTSINYYAFKNCTNLEVVTCNTRTVPSTQASAFDGSYTEYATLIVPDASLSNYQTTAPWSNFGTILPMSQASVVTANSYTREYGDPNPTFEFTCATTLNGIPAITCTADATSAPGTYPITISQGTVTNTGLFFVNGTLIVTKAPLTISAGNYTVNVGDAMPNIEQLTYNGFKNNETKDNLTTQPTISCSATNTSTEGVFPIVASGATSDNYNINYVNGTLIVKPFVPTIVISSAGVATYCSTNDLDFSGVTAYKAYTAMGYNKQTGNITVVEVKDAPAGTGLYIKGTPGVYEEPAGLSNSYFLNMLVGTTAPTTISPIVDGFKNLILYNGANGVGFYTLASDYTVGANKAYLQLPAELLGSNVGANFLGIEYEEGVDGIENIDMSAADNAVWYSLDGRQLNGKPTQKGIYVVNGRKVVIK